MSSLDLDAPATTTRSTDVQVLNDQHLDGMQQSVEGNNAALGISASDSQLDASSADVENEELPDPLPGIALGRSKLATGFLVSVIPSTTPMFVHRKSG